MNKATQGNNKATLFRHLLPCKNPLFILSRNRCIIAFFTRQHPYFFDALLLPCVALFALNKKIPPTFFKSTELKFNLSFL